MRSLIWSEWRTKRLWGLPLLAAVILPLLFGSPFTFWGQSVFADPSLQLYKLSGALMPAMLIALFFGAMAFAGELGMGTQDFLLSRPVSWKKLLAAKVIVGLGIITLVSLVGAIAFRMLCPEQYLPFLSAGRLASGFGIAVAVMGVPYLAGVTCSVVLPGAVGSVLTLLAVAIAVGVELVILGMLPKDRIMYTNPAVMVLPWSVGLALAAVLVVRFGLTLPLANRAAKYALAVIGCVICLTPVVASIHPSEPPREATRYSYNMSPNMSHMILIKESGVFTPSLGSQDDYFWTVTTYFQRLSDGKRAVLSKSDSSSYTIWLNENTLIWIEMGSRHEPTGGWVSNRAVVRARMEDNGQIVTRRAELGNLMIADTSCISPGGKLMLLRVYGNARDHSESNIVAYAFLDLEAMKVLDVRLNAKEVGYQHWWQNDRVFGYKTSYSSDTRYMFKVR